MNPPQINCVLKSPSFLAEAWLWANRNFRSGGKSAGQVKGKEEPAARPVEKKNRENALYGSL
jgi:hypothetical protein